MYVCIRYGLIESLSVIWEWDLSDKIKQGCFQFVAVSVRLRGSTVWTLTKCMA